jgi:hypothetical protein
MEQKNQNINKRVRKKPLLPLRKDFYGKTINELYVELGETKKKEFWAFVEKEGLAKSTVRKDLTRPIEQIPDVTRYLVYKKFFGKKLPQIQTNYSHAD